MTRKSGYTLIKPPCCNATFAVHNYGSMNHSADEYWTDGRHVGSLAPQDYGLCRCACGAWFLESLADVIRNIPTNLVLVDEHWTESQLDVQFAQYVKDENLSEILLCGADTQVITTTRRRYWQYLNDPYREVYRKHKSAGFDGVPTYEPSEEQMENLAELAALLERQKKPPWLDLVEIHRELGEFDLAGRLCCYEALEYSVDSATYEGYRQWLLEQIERRVRAPLRYRW